MANPLKCAFSTNWNNKLSCDYFSTLRLYSNEFIVGHTYDIELKSKHFKFAECRCVKVLNIEEVSEYIAGLDIGYDIVETKKIIKTMYKNLNLDWTTQRLVFVLFKTVN